MGIPIPWICTKCGRTTTASQKPGTNGTDYGKCPKAPQNGLHNWVKK